MFETTKVRLRRLRARWKMQNPDCRLTKAAVRILLTRVYAGYYVSRKINDNGGFSSVQ